MIRTKQLSTFSVVAILAMGLASFPGSSNAQQKLVKGQLVGTWTLVSCTGANSSPQTFCVDPNGRLVIDAGGRYVQVIAARGRPKSTPAANRTAITAEEYKAAAQGVVANFGTWSFNEADQTVTAHVEAALFPNGEGTDAKSSVSLAGDELKLVGANGGVNVWRRTR
jgi:hypothetical protein